jgi:hypothetical protein
MSGGDLFWNLSQERRLRGLSHEAEVASRGAGRTADDLARMQADLDRLALACAALWSLLKDAGHTEEQLAARMQELDLRDGKLDGKLALDVVTCTGCGRKSRPERKTCMYCSTPLPRGAAFGG